MQVDRGTFSSPSSASSFATCCEEIELERDIEREYCRLQFIESDFGMYKMIALKNCDYIGSVALYIVGKIGRLHFA